MTAKEKIEHLKSAIEDCDKVYDTLRDVLGASPETPLFYAISRLQYVAIRATAESIGLEIEALEWFVLENEFGSKGFVCGKDGKEVVVDSIDAFLHFEGVPSA